MLCLQFGAHSCGSKRTDPPWKLTPSPTPVRSPVTPETQAKLIEMIYGDTSQFKYVVDKDRTLYLMVPEPVFSRLPKQVNGVMLTRVTEKDITSDFHHAYIEYKGWGEVDNTIFVQDVAHFWGGNLGWFARRFVRTSDGFKQLDPECRLSLSTRFEARIAR